MSLVALQRHMLGYLLQNSDSNRSDHLVELQALVGDNSPAQGLQIYHHAYSARLIEVLGNEHEKLWRFLGTDAFNQLAREFVAAHPSHVRSLRHYGARLPDFLRDCGHPDAELASQLCAFERVLLDVYDAPFGDQLQVDVLGLLAPDDWPGLRLTVHPSVRIFLDETGAIPMWQRCQQELAQAAPVRDAPDSGSDLGTARHWVLWRDRTRVCQFRCLDPAEHAALDVLLIDGKSLAAAAEDLLAVTPAQELAPAIQQWLNQWLTDGLISKLA